MAFAELMDSADSGLVSAFVGFLFMVGVSLANRLIWGRIVFSHQANSSKGVLVFLIGKNIFLVGFLATALLAAGLDVLAFCLGCLIGLVCGLFWMSRKRTSETC